MNNQTCNSETCMYQGGTSNCFVKGYCPLVTPEKTTCDGECSDCTKCDDPCDI